ncbi:MAG: hypothetical protein HQM08_05900 [Candidatus Riflebacteria bacterium]|nr:hypothetical protein [Candidatus Riflebacteria bacterium]
MRDLSGGWVIVRLFKPDSDEAVYYKLEKNRLVSQLLPEDRHTAYWVYMFEKAFAFHRMQYDFGSNAGGKPKDYVGALRTANFASVLNMLVGKTRAGDLIKGRQMQVNAIERLNELKLFDGYLSRAVNLILDPDIVD